jgi:hypothetical protein
VHLNTVNKSIRLLQGDSRLNTGEGRGRRPFILLVVLLLHGAAVLLSTRNARRQTSLSPPISEPLMLLLLPNRALVAPNASMLLRPADARQLARPKSRDSSPEPAASSAITAGPEMRSIDWDIEAGLAARNVLATADKENEYRNLSALSPEQLSWVRQNHLEPAPPGIAWTYRRIEITEGGFPIIHINDHCIAIPLMMFMVFCKVGHIEPKGDLFDHMRDPHNP